MANLCSIEILIPLKKVPDTEEREQLTALYEAEKKWGVAVKTNDELRRGKNYHEYIASQPGVPNERTRWSNFGGSFKGRPGEVLKPDSEQWNTPTIHASFEDRDGQIWVHPYSFGRGDGLLFDNADGITFERPKGYMYSPYLPMRRDFKWSFPWWAEVGFAGGEKFCNTEAQDPPKGKDDKFYEEWMNEHGQPMAFLLWELKVEKVLRNLEYCIKVYENLPINGLAWEFSYVWKELKQLTEIYEWIKKVHRILPEAIARLDWSEVAWNGMSYQEARENDDPNQFMASVKEMEVDTKDFKEGKLNIGEYRKKYAMHLRTGSEDSFSYQSVTEKDPFEEYIFEKK